MKQNCKLLTALLAALLLCLLLTGCGGDAAEEEPAEENTRSIEAVDEEQQPETPEESEEPEEPEDDSDISAYIGCWKYDDAPFYYVIGGEHEWMAINAYGTTIGPLKCTGGENGLELFDENGQIFTVFAAPINGRMMDADGNVLSGMEYIMLLPTPEDELNQTIAFPGDFSGISVSYPVTMNAKKHPNLSAGLSFNAEMEDGTDDYYSNITVSFQPVSGYDSYMTQGYATASKYLRTMLDQLAGSMYGNYLLKSVGSDVEDCGSYYSIKGYLWLDGSVFMNADAGTPVRAVMDIRYYGPIGYVLVTTSVALENRIENYYLIGENIVNSCTINVDWSTAPKALPANADTKKSQAVTGGSDPGDYGTSYYWYDDDGDVWYWNGYEDEFIGFGDDYYIDDDGQYYESNDAGWDDDYYDYDWDYYDDDYDIWSDPGDGYDAWSDPGDYYYDDGWGDYFDDDWDY